MGGGGNRGGGRMPRVEKVPLTDAKGKVVGHEYDLGRGSDIRQEDSFKLKSHATWVARVVQAMKAINAPELDEMVRTTKDYSGRGQFGREGPGVYLDSATTVDKLLKRVKGMASDNMGRGYVVYMRNPEQPKGKK